MKKILLAAIVISLAAGGFLFWQSKKYAPIRERLPQVSGSTVFNPQEAAVGDMYGRFQVASTQYMPPTASYPYDVYDIDFSGTLTLIGTLDANELCGWGIKNIPTSTAQQLPRDIAKTHLPLTMYLDLTNLPPGEGPKSSNDEGVSVQVTIDRYQLAEVPKDCGGDYGHVTSFKKI